MAVELGVSAQRSAGWNHRRVTAAWWIGALSLYGGAVVAWIALQPERFQWDLKVYLRAGRAFAMGADPFAANAHASTLPFLYPVWTLPVFRALAALPERAAVTLFLAAKLVALVALVRVWQRSIVRERLGPMFWAIAFLAFHHPIYCDLATGNVTIFEQLALWSAFGFYLRGRTRAFCALVALAASIKLTPLFFLALLFVRSEPRRWRLTAATLGLFVAPHLLAFIVAPGLETSWLRHLGDASGLGLGGDIDASTLGLVRRVLAGAKLDPTIAGLALYAAIAIALTVVSYRVARRHALAPSRACRVDEIMFACVLYAIVMPRMVVYQYVVLVLPAYWFVRRSRTVVATPLLVALLCVGVVHHPNLGLPVVRVAGALAFEYFPLVAALALWALAMRLVASAAVHVSVPPLSMHQGSIVRVRGGDEWRTEAPVTPFAERVTVWLPRALAIDEDEHAH